jgi:hypothetical protein
MRIGLATCLVKPEEDPDEGPLLASLRRAGATCDLLPWDDPSRDPAAFDLVVVRSTWNYPRDPDGFRAWIDRAASATRVLNPPAILRWNLHKRYLLELESGGVPIVPTLFVDRFARIDLRAALRARGWDDVVVKPAVSAASYRTRRFDRGALDEAEKFLAGLIAERDAMVQPYLPSVETHPERSVMWIDGLVTHAVEKMPRLAGAHEDVSGARGVEDEERDLVARALAGRTEGLLYARADFMRDLDGRSVLSELELLEPSLFLLQHPPALARLAAAIIGAARAAVLRRSGPSPRAREAGR